MFDSLVLSSVSRLYVYQAIRVSIFMLNRRYPSHELYEISQAVLPFPTFFFIFCGNYFVNNLIII